MAALGGAWAAGARQWSRSLTWGTLSPPWACPSSVCWRSDPPPASPPLFCSCYPIWMDFSECMSKTEDPKACKDFRDDYLECLHHRKEVRRAAVATGGGGGGVRRRWRGACR